MAATDKLLRWTIDNIYTIARREAKRAGASQNWRHVMRLCAAAGAHGLGVLRDDDNSGLQHRSGARGALDIKVESPP